MNNFCKSFVTNHCIICWEKFQPGISFHNFPSTSNHILLEKWIKACGKPKGWRPNPTSVICGKHFLSSQKDGISLQKFAIPTIDVKTQFYAETEVQTDEIFPDTHEYDKKILHLTTELYSTQNDLDAANKLNEELRKRILSFESRETSEKMIKIEMHDQKEWNDDFDVS